MTGNPRTFIVGTDWWTDCDDAVAMRLLVRAAKKGEIHIAGIVMNACMEHSVTSLDGFLTREGFDDVPIGIDLAACDFSGRPTIQHRLAPFASRYRCNEDAEDGVQLYRRLLAAAEGKVEMIEIGFLQVLAALLESGPDELSPLTGIELVRRKVEHVWVMAGKWDEAVGSEHNFNHGPRARWGGHVFCEKCPVPVTFLGFEIGVDVITGRSLGADVLHDVLMDHGSPNGRSSWDPMLALLAVTGDPEAEGYDAIRGYASVSAEDGSNTFTRDPKGQHRYVVRRHAPQWYEARIEPLIR